MPIRSYLAVKYGRVRYKIMNHNTQNCATNRKKTQKSPHVRRSLFRSNRSSSCHLADQIGTTSPQLHPSTSSMPTSYEPMLTDPPIAPPGDAIPRPLSPTPVCLPCNPPAEHPPEDEVVPMAEPPPEDEMAEPPPEDEVDPTPDDEVVKVRMMLNAQKASPKKNPNTAMRRLWRQMSCG